MNETRSPANFPRDRLVELIPDLRAFALSLTRSPPRADDLVQETLMKALTNQDKFTPGSNLRAWLFVILRNTHHSEYRKRKREVEDPDGLIAGNWVPEGYEDRRMEAQACMIAFARLPEEQREALFLVAAMGLSCEEAADSCGVAVGTIKSRVSRARAKLTRALNQEAPAEGTLAAHDG